MISVHIQQKDKKRILITKKHTYNTEIDKTGKIYCPDHIISAGRVEKKKNIVALPIEMIKTV